MANAVSVDFVTKVVEIEVNDNKTESLAAAAAINAAARADQAADLVVNRVDNTLAAIDEKGEEEVEGIEEYSSAKKSDILEAGQRIIGDAETILTAIRNEYGYPFAAATAADMTDPAKIYVYTGNEAGYIIGNWYYHNGTAFVSGGAFNSTAFEADKTLAVEDMAADAAAVGDFVQATYNLLDKFNVPLINGYFTSSSTTISASTKTRTLYIPCVPNANYIVARKNNYSRWVVATSQTEPSVGTTITNVPSFSETTVGTMVYRKYVTPADANYLAVFFYHSDYDTTVTAQQMLDDMMIYEGTDILPYIQHKLAIPYKDVLTEFLSLKAELATSVIPDGTDIDDVVTPGTYIVPLGTNAQTMTNMPAELGGRLIVMETSTSSSLSQIYVANTSAASSVPRMFYRGYHNGSWHNWVEITTSANSLFSTGTILTSTNYTNYFTSYNDAPVNSVFGISTDVPLTDGPMGDTRIVTDASASGYIRGVLLTFTQKMSRAGSTTAGSNVVQMLLGYRRANAYKPTLSYRVQVEGTWSEWSKFEENGYLHASNIVVYGGHLDASFSDLNDMPSNTIYQLDLNLDGSDADHTLLNHPAPGVSCVAMCYAFSYSISHGKVQTVYTVDGRLYWRYGYLNATDDYRWTNWVMCLNDDGKNLRNEGALANGSNLNTVTGNSIYLLNTMPSAGYINNPITTGAGFLTTKAASGILLQVVEALNGTRYSRYSDDSETTWSSWV